MYCVLFNQRFLELFPSTVYCFLPTLTIFSSGLLTTGLLNLFFGDDLLTLIGIIVYGVMKLGPDRTRRYTPDVAVSSERYTMVTVAVFLKDTCVVVRLLLRGLKGTLILTGRDSYGLWEIFKMEKNYMAIPIGVTTTLQLSIMN